MLELIKMNSEFTYWYFDEDLYIKIPIQYQKNKQLKVKTPQHLFLKKKKLDVSREMGCIKAIYQKIISLGFDIKKTGDFFAGCGFSGKIMKKYLNCSEIILNDLSSECVNILKENFSNYTILNLDAFDIELKNNLDLIQLDFNSFSILDQKIRYWFQLIQYVSIKTNQWVLLADSACFGFKFGEKNLQTYGVKTIPEYYEKERIIFKKRFGLTLAFVAAFPNSAVCAFYKGNWKSDIQYLTYKEVPIEFTIYPKLCN